MSANKLNFAAALFALLMAVGCTFDSTGSISASGDGSDAGPDDKEDRDGSPLQPVPDGGQTPDGGAGTPDGSPGAPDAASVEVSEDVFHVPAGSEYGGSADLVLSGGVIDTSALTINGFAPPAGTSFEAQVQPGTDSIVSILHVRAFSVQPEANVRVVGSRPLIVIATGPAVVAGVLDGSGKQAHRGAGGGRPGMGPGAGGQGEVGENGGGSGGGGAGFGVTGASGGNSDCDFGICDFDAYGGDGGSAYGSSSLPVLRGGSGGGGPSDQNCSQKKAGAGGGAIQIYSASSISILSSGGINVGGGGGGGGATCSEGGSGSGAGSGGAIYLQAPSVTNQGVLAANGGGGGGGGDAWSAGENGQDGRLGADAAHGGDNGSSDSSEGGNGGTGSHWAQDGDDTSQPGNAGGGGGSEGRIVVRFHPASGFENTGVTSPTPYGATYGTY